MVKEKVKQESVQKNAPINNRKKSKSLNLKTNNTEDNDEDKKE